VVTLPIAAYSGRNAGREMFEYACGIGLEDVVSTVRD
jgi:hypothetical protein